MNKLPFLGLVIVALAASAFLQRSAQTPTGPGRWEIALKYCCASGQLVADECKDLRGTDVISGEVEGKIDGDEIVYEGVLQRETNLPYCEVWRPAGSSEDRFCKPSLKGKQREVKVKITLDAGTPPLLPRDGAFVQFTPIPRSGDSAVVNGACTTEMADGMKEVYLREESFEITERKTNPLRGGLSVGTWQDDPNRPANQPDGWTLEVKRRVR